MEEETEIKRHYYNVQEMDIDKELCYQSMESAAEVQWRTFKGLQWRMGLRYEDYSVIFA